ncbi:MAG TPA: prolyl oligopeptidase family serine peptidase [Terriglobales bacterium]|nr:prolyl oligopeptidase family serine peptidase [Terriglobales bacterium]
MLLLATPVLLGLAASLRAETNALPVEDVVMSPEIAVGSSVSVSQDGKFVAYTVVRGHSASTQTTAKDVPWFARATDIHVINLITNNDENITRGEGCNWEPVWSPEGSLLAFLSDRDSKGKINLWIWDAETRALKKQSSLAAKHGSIEWTNAGQGLIFSGSSGPPISGGLLTETLEKPSGPNVPTVRLYQSLANSEENERASPWSLDDYSAELVWSDLASAKARVIFQGKIGTYKLSPDGSRVAVSVATSFAKPGSQQVLFDVAVLTLDSGERRVVLSGVQLAPDGSGFSWSPDGKRLCLRVKNRTEDADIYQVLDLGNSDILTLHEPADPSPGRKGTAPVWDELGRSIYFVRNGKLWHGDTVHGTACVMARIAERQIVGLVAGSSDRLWLLRREFVFVITHDDSGKQDGVYEVNLRTGDSRKLIEQGQCYTCVLDNDSIVASRNGQTVILVAEDAAHAPELWKADPEFRSLRQLTHVNTRLGSHTLGTARLIDWLSDDGEPLHGALLLPSNYRPGQRYPLVVYIYGGIPLSDRFDRFGLAGSGPFNMQLLATRGYAVLLPDAPQHVGTPMLDLAKTVLPGVNRAIELGIADPDRLAVMGHSYGGYSTLCLIVQTGRFKAAISIAGDSDLFGSYAEMQENASAYGVAIAEHGQGAMGGTPWERRERFIENSPFFYFDRIQTPLLIIQGSTDTAVAPFLGDQIFVALRRLGKEAAYAKYEGEGHSPAQEWSYEHQVDVSYRMIRWLDEHLK